MVAISALTLEDVLPIFVSQRAIHKHADQPWFGEGVVGCLVRFKKGSGYALGRVTEVHRIGLFLWHKKKFDVELVTDSGRCSLQSVSGTDPTEDEWAAFIGKAPEADIDVAKQLEHWNSTVAERTITPEDTRRIIEHNKELGKTRGNVVSTLTLLRYQKELLERNVMDETQASQVFQGNSLDENATQFRDAVAARSETVERLASMTDRNVQLNRDMARQATIGTSDERLGFEVPQSFWEVDDDTRSKLAKEYEDEQERKHQEGGKDEEDATAKRAREQYEMEQSAMSARRERLRKCIVSNQSMLKDIGSAAPADVYDLLSNPPKPSGIPFELALCQPVLNKT